MKNILKNKFFIILFTFILFTFLYINHSFAYDSTTANGTVFVYPDTIVDYLKSTEYWNNDYACLGVYWDNSRYDVWFIKKTDTLKIKFGLDDNSADYGYYFAANQKITGCRYQFNNSLSLVGSYPISNMEWTNETCWSWYGKALNRSTFLLANSDFYATGDGRNNFSGNKLVFLAPPPVVEEQEKVQILTLEGMKVEELPMKMAQVTMIILPVCLGVLGILLVLFLIKSKNLLQL